MNTTSTTTPNLSSRANTSPIILNRRLGTTSSDISTTPVRTPSKQAYTTEIVKALFQGSGGSIGDVINDFSCSFQRQAGRLYISTTALFFYSNLFGFEKRIRIDYEATTITKIRSTSLHVKKKEGDKYIFRSFEDRDYVLEIIMEYHSNNNKEGSESIHHVTTSPSSPGLEDDDTSLVGDNQDDKSVRGDSPMIPVCITNECQRNVSQTEVVEDLSRSASTAKVEDNVPTGESTESWQQLKQKTKDWELAVVNLKLLCKVEDFFQLFLRDDAVYGLQIFLKEAGDTNIHVGNWKKEDNTTSQGSNPLLSRLLTYDHQSGLAIAKVTRQQTYQCCGKHAYLKNVTKISGIRAVPSDTFFIEDIWLIEREKNEGIALNIHFQIQFLKSTMLKSVIKNRSTIEARELYKSYVTFLRKKMNQKAPADEVPTTSPAETDWFGLLQSLTRQYIPVLSQNVHILFIIVLAFVVYRLRQRVTALEDVINEFEHRLVELEQQDSITSTTIELDLN